METIIHCFGRSAVMGLINLPIYGTVHIICSEDAQLSESFKNIISRTDEVFFEIDLDDLTEMMTSIQYLKMRGDTTLEDLLSPEEVEKVKDYFAGHAPVPYAAVKNYYPIITITILLKEILNCNKNTGIEEVIMEIAQEKKKTIRGLEDMRYQMGLMDSIPYKEQAKQLILFIDSSENKEQLNHQIEKLYETYQKQDLVELERITFEMDSTMDRYDDLLVYNRNKNWVKAFKKMPRNNQYVIAVGAAHLPGDEGILNLFRKEGYKITPLKNDLPVPKK